MLMLKVAYITNEFPVAVEPYVVEEIRELRKHGVQIIASSVRRPPTVHEELLEIAAETVYLPPLNLHTLMYAAWLCLRHGNAVASLFSKALISHEPLPRRVRAVVHTLLGVYYAALLKRRHVEHIHVHHGYFAAWVAMTAARLLGITYSMTLHGSDLLLHHSFLDLKLQNCKFCLTISEFNRQHILANYPNIPAEKIRVQHMGVDTLTAQSEPEHLSKQNSQMVMLSVGRLHAVKDHGFLLRACSRLKARGVHFICLIAGEGPERAHLEQVILDLDLQCQVKLLGHVSKAKLATYYTTCDLVVLTSRSEGIPLALMEAMAHGRTVLAPAITGIPELVLDGTTGYLYRAGSLEDFVARVEAIRAAQPTLGIIRRRARRHVLEHFNRTTNLAEFAKLFPALVACDPHENSLLQQV